MNRMLFAFFALFVCSSLSAKEWDSLTTLDGKVYEKVTLRGKTASGIKIFHKAGAATIPFENLPPEVQEELGGFDKAAAKKERALNEEKRKARIKYSQARREKRKRHHARYAAVLELIRVAKAKEDSLNTQTRREGKASRTVYENLYKFLKQYPEESDKTINEWVKALSKREVIIGMPEVMVRLSWGKPDKINKSSYGSDQWIYSQGGYSSKYLYMKDGRLKGFNES